ncbi:hypothetical protein [Luteimonas saliphila]|uniref:hypothetical protein n=1 Tax=Luteimonas saliphila TaxID=2804919 RepID=UPI00192DEB13|nr:hypothetical protein [Luteimonas saliphila]
MSDTPATALHLHIGRLVVDADALGADGLPRDVDAMLHGALSERLGIPAGTPAPARAAWIAPVADALATQVASAMPGRTR